MADAAALVLRIDGEEPEVDVGVVRMTLVLNGAGLESPRNRAGPGGEEGGDVAGIGAPRRRIAAGQKGDGDAGGPFSRKAP